MVRHAQPAWVRDGKSVLDPELTELGQVQAERLARRLGTLSVQPTELIVSPTRRTRQTAAPIARALELDPVVVEGLEEIRLPSEWEGAPAETIGNALRAARDRSAEDWWAGLPGGEGFTDFAERIRSCLWSLLSDRGLRPPEHAEAPWSRTRDEKRRLVIVAHGGTNAVITSLLLGIEHVPWAWERFITLHAAMTRLQARPLLGGWLFGLREHSDAGHLDPELRSR